MKRSVWCASAAAVAAGMILIAPMSTRAESKLPSGISAAGISLEGMTEGEAGKKISDYVEKQLDQALTLSIEGSETKASADALGILWENKEAIKDGIHAAKPAGSLIKRYMKTKDLSVSPVELLVELDMDGERLTAFIHENCPDAVPDAADASICRKDGNFIVTPSVTGKTVDAENTKKNLNEAINTGLEDSLKLQVAVEAREPRIKTEDLSSIKDVLGTYSTDFKTSGAARSTNLAVGTAKINGHVLLPGEVLSGYECMHPFTLENGYKTAGAYENGRSVDSIGGGVCQIATTLYNAALQAELDIVQRQNHSMLVSYVKPSMDAAIAGTYKDIKVGNPYDTALYVEGYTSGKTLTFTIYGKETRPSNRTVKYESETLQTIDAGPPIETVDPSLQPGQRVRVESGHTGLKSKLYKCVYVDGELKEKTLLNTDSYKASKAVYRVGPEAPPQETAVSVPPAGTESAAAEPSAPTVSEGQTEEFQQTGPGASAGPGMTPQGPGYEGPSAENVGPGFEP